MMQSNIGGMLLGLMSWCRGSIASRGKPRHFNILEGGKLFVHCNTLPHMKHWVEPPQARFEEDSIKVSCRTTAKL